jgi:hypothetical protein
MLFGHSFSLKQFGRDFFSPSNKNIGKDFCRSLKKNPLFMEKGTFRFERKKRKENGSGVVFGSRTKV